jgi:hypothetical protein
MSHPRLRIVTAGFVFALGFALALVLATGAPRPAVASDETSAAPAHACDRSAAVEAAKAALARGDREGAIEHLRDAERMLEICADSRAPATPDQEEFDAGETAFASLSSGSCAQESPSPASSTKRGSGGSEPSSGRRA